MEYYFNPQMAEGSWEEQISTISFDEMHHTPSTDLPDHSWKTLAACGYANESPSFLYSDILADALRATLGDDIQMNINERSSPPPPADVNQTHNSSVASSVSLSTSTSPNTSASSGVYSCSDFETLSPLSFDAPGSRIQTQTEHSNDRAIHEAYQIIDEVMKVIGSNSDGVSNQAFGSADSPNGGHHIFKTAETQMDHIHNQGFGVNFNAGRLHINDQACVPYQPLASMEHMSINQRLLSYAPSRNIYQESPRVPFAAASVDWQSQLPSPTLPKATNKSSNKPPETYIALIAKAILVTPSKKALLSDIYSYALQMYDYYHTANKTWRNAIRHNLSINECFIKNGRAPQGRGFFWSVHPACLRSFLRGDFRRREARQLAVDMDRIQHKKLPQL